MRKLTFGLCAITVVATANLVPAPNPFQVRHQEVVKTFKSVTGNGFDRIPRITPESMLAVNGKQRQGDINNPAHADHLRQAFREVRTATDVFQMELLQLVGLLKEAQPVAYVAKTSEEMRIEAQSKLTAGNNTGPSPDLRAARFKTRPLEEAEMKGLKLLQAGNDFVPLEIAGQHAYIGAIRADKTCLECHDTHHEGSLLGAFVYQYDAGKMPQAKPLTSNP
jgi:hypothetical protein